MSHFTSKTLFLAGVILFSILAAAISFSGNTVQAAESSPEPTPTPTILADYALSGSSGAGGTINPLGNQFAYPGESLVFTITPNFGYKILDVTVDGVSQGPKATYSFDNVTESHEVTASFTLDTVFVTGFVVLLAVVIAAVGLSAMFLVRKRFKNKV